MSVEKRVLGCFSIVSGALITYIIYAIMQHDNFINPTLFLALFGAASVATIIFTIANHFFSKTWIKIAVGAAVNYMLWIAIIFGSRPDAETIMWLPVIMVFGVLFTGPLLVGAWFGSLLLMPVRPITK